MVITPRVDMACVWHTELFMSSLTSSWARHSRYSPSLWHPLPLFTLVLSPSLHLHKTTDEILIEKTFRTIKLHSNSFRKMEREKLFSQEQWKCLFINHFMNYCIEELYHILFRLTSSEVFIDIVMPTHTAVYVNTN